MSLKAFHFVFVLASLALSAFFTFWAWNDYRASEATSSLLMASGGLVATLALIVYFGWIIKKLKRYSYLVLALAFSQLVSAQSWACSVCVGNPNSPMTKAANAGVVFLLGVVGTLLVGFAGLFLFWMWRSHRASLA